MFPDAGEALCRPRLGAPDVPRPPPGPHRDRPLVPAGAGARWAATDRLPGGDAGPPGRDTLGAGLSNVTCHSWQRPPSRPPSRRPDAPTARRRRAGGKLPSWWTRPRMTSNRQERPPPRFSQAVPRQRLAHSRGNLEALSTNASSWGTSWGTLPRMTSYLQDLLPLCLSQPVPRQRLADGPRAPGVNSDQRMA